MFVGNILLLDLSVHSRTIHYRKHYISKAYNTLIPVGKKICPNSINNGICKIIPFIKFIKKQGSKAHEREEKGRTR